MRFLMLFGLLELTSIHLFSMNSADDTSIANPVPVCTSSHTIQIIPEQLPPNGLCSETVPHLALRNSLNSCCYIPLSRETTTYRLISGIRAIDDDPTRQAELLQVMGNMTVRVPALEEENVQNSDRVMQYIIDAKPLITTIEIYLRQHAELRQKQHQETEQKTIRSRTNIQQLVACATLCTTAGFFARPLLGMLYNWFKG